MFPSNQGLLIADDTAQLGDALLTIVRAEVRQETPEATSRRRLETFVLRAERLVARLAERQDALDIEMASLRRQEALLRYQIAEILSWQETTETALHSLAEALYEERAERQAQAQRAYDLALQRSVLQAQTADGLTKALHRIADLEYRMFSARWARFVAWVRRLV